MPDTVHERHAASLEDYLRDCPGSPHVVDHLAARLLREDRLREEGRDEIAGHELAGIVDEEAAVGVTVVRDAEVPSRVFATMNSRFSGSSGFGSWFGKVPSGSK